MQVLLKNGRIIDPSQEMDKVVDLLIQDGIVAKIDKVDEQKLDSDCDIIDCTGLVVAPGFIDMHVHLREPGFEHKETIETGAQAAAAGGFTTIVAMPNTEPAIDNGAMVEFVVNRGLNSAVNVLVSGAATKKNEGSEMAEIGVMVAAGAVAISDDAFPVQNADLMRRVMEYARMFDVPVLVHCEDKSMTRDAVANEGINSTILGLRPWPRQAEEIMIIRNIMLAELTGCRLHIQHITTAGGVDAVRWAKMKGLAVTCETCPQYFSLTDEALGTFDTSAKCNPPLRTAEDVEAIKQGLADGTIDAIATDHAPHAREDKEVELQYAAFGMVGLETALGLTITNLVETGIISLSDAIAKLTAAPAKILDLAAGNLKEGADADITIFDPGEKWTVDKNKFKSMGRNTPFDRLELIGKSIAVIVDGEVRFGKISA